MAFKAKWSNEVREAVERYALSPERLSARAIHDALAVGAVPGITGPMVPPPATVSRWVHEHRRVAGEVISADGQGDTMTHVLTALRRTLKREARHAKTAAEIRAVAAAARELAALERDLQRASEPKAPRGKRGGDVPAPTEQDDAQRAFLESMARDSGPGDTQHAGRQDRNARAPQRSTDQNGRKLGRAAAS